MYSLFRRWLALLANALYVLQIKFTCMVYQWYIVWYRFICVSTWSRNWICTQYSNPSKKKSRTWYNHTIPAKTSLPRNCCGYCFCCRSKEFLGVILSLTFALGPVDLRGTWSRNLVPADLLNFCDFFLALPSYALLFFAFLWIRAIYVHVTTRS